MSGIYTLIYTLKYTNAAYMMTFRNFVSIKYYTQSQAWRHRRKSNLFKGACAVDVQIFTEDFVSISPIKCYRYSLNSRKKANIDCVYFYMGHFKSE